MAMLGRTRELPVACKVDERNRKHPSANQGLMAAAAAGRRALGGRSTRAAVASDGACRCRAYTQITQCTVLCPRAPFSLLALWSELRRKSASVSWHFEVAGEVL